MKQNDADIIIIGAGAAGLMAASYLARNNKSVLVLEANDRAGGRIHTVKEKGFKHPIELGAEFIHGDVPITIQLLKDAAVKYYELDGRFVSFRGKPHKEKDFVEEPGLMEKKLKELKKDIPVKAFLEKNFSGGKYRTVRNSIKGFVEGYDTADTKRASTFAFRNEWMESDGHQYRIEGGYIKLIDYLVDQCKNHQAIIKTSSVVKNVNWKKGAVRVTTADSQRYSAGQVLTTVPLGVLTAKRGKAAIKFSPAIPAYRNAAERMGYGSIIKVHLEFDHPVWEDESLQKRTGVSTDKLGFIFSDQKFPTWWTQYPKQSNLLTGWLGGPPAKRAATSDEQLIDTALLSLSTIFKMTKKELKQMVKAAKITNWNKERFALGSYNYSVIGDFKYRRVLNTPVKDTIWFAGEALHEGPVAGTVEAALASGFATADGMLRKGRQ